jgi:hypothetical protein
MTELSASVKRNPWIQAWARLGFAIGGIVYFVIGILAIMVAYENSGAVPGPEGAIERIGAQPFGRVLLVIVTVGLFGYAFWCCIQAVFDTDRDGNDLKVIGIRFGEFCSGVAYLSLAILSWHRLQGAGPEGNQTAYWTATVLAHTWGAPLVALTGAVLAVVGIALIVYGIQERFCKYLRITDASASDRHWMIRMGKWGYSAQGIVFCVIGSFLVSAAVTADARKARGLDGALQWIAQQSYGPWLLGFVALGLAAYGLFMLVEARYRRLT